MAKTPLEQLRELVEVQGRDGNWNCDPYMHGMFNGMEFALSIMENREPVYRQAPPVWLSDLPAPDIIEDTSGVGVPDGR